VWSQAARNPPPRQQTSKGRAVPALSRCDFTHAIRRLKRPDCKTAGLPEIHHVNVGSESGIVGKVKAFVIWILIDYDPVGIPTPVVAEAVVVRGDIEVEAAKPETFPVSTHQPKVMPAAKTTRETTMLPRAIGMIAWIAAPAVMSDPSIVGMDVRGVWVSRPVAVAAVFLRLAFVTPASVSPGTMRGDVFAAVVIIVCATVIVATMVPLIMTLVPVLSKCRKTDH
jgi:hypothetical protein